MISSLKNIKRYSITRLDGRVIEKYRFKQTTIKRKQELEKIYGEVKICKDGVPIE